MEKISEYREIARMLKDGKTVVKKTRITKERCLEESLSGGFTGNMWRRTYFVFTLQSCEDAWISSVDH